MGSVSFDDFMREELADPEVRAEWERTAVGRALGLWLIGYRNANGLDFDQLAARLGLDFNGLADLESGDEDPPAATLLWLSRTLGVPVELRVERGLPGEAVVETILVDATAARAA